MTSGKTLRLMPVLLTFCMAGSTYANDIDPSELLARLAQPGPATTAFVELRYSALLNQPLLLSGELEHRTDGAFIRRVTSPYLETTTLFGDSVLVERDGGKPRSFSLQRAPELRGLLASFGALLQGDRAMLERHFRLTVRGSNSAWQIELSPLEAGLARRIAVIVIDGSDGQARCFATMEPDGDASIMAVNVPSRASLPASLQRESLQEWCREAGRH